MLIDDPDAAYREVLLAPLRTCADYKPVFGTNESHSLEQFTGLYGRDPLYHWIGLDSPLMYAAHKAAGGITSIYRQLGIGCERLVRRVLQDALSLQPHQVTWSYEVATVSDSGEERIRKLSLDGRIETADLVSMDARMRISDWIEERRRALRISVPLKGLVIEVRQGYKSADSKRQNADLANAAQAIGQGYLPVLMVMSSQMNQAVRTRYLTGNWTILAGSAGTSDPSVDTFDFCEHVVGYDLRGFFQRNEEILRREVEGVLQSLLGVA